jgi:hypothetical protein
MVEEKKLPVFVKVIIVFVIAMSVVWLVLKIVLECCMDDEAGWKLIFE